MNMKIYYWMAQFFTEISKMTTIMKRMTETIDKRMRQADKNSGCLCFFLFSDDVSLFSSPIIITFSIFSYIGVFLKKVFNFTFFLMEKKEK